MGIQTFQDIFDIQKRTDESINNSSVPIARFSGQGIAWSGEADNIWNGIKPEDNNPYSSPLNKGLNLTYTSLTKQRQELLDFGRQKHYNWSLNKSVTKSIFMVDATGMKLSKFGNNGDTDLPWNFSQNFINIDFIIAGGIWTTRYVNIFERTEPSVG